MRFLMQNVLYNGGNHQGLPLLKPRANDTAPNVNSDTVRTEEGKVWGPVLWGCKGFEK